MKKIILLISILSITFSCKSNKNLSTKNNTTYANTITVNDVKKHIFTLASDEFEGRETGEQGLKDAADYIAKQYTSFGIKKYPKSASYFQSIPIEALKTKRFTPNNPSQNIIAYIEGTEKPDEVLVISSHYDHLGVRGEDIYNGADDNASGTTAVMEIAQAFAKAKKEGHGPKRSILFLNVTGEEKGLLGSKYFAANPILPLQNIVADLNIDMIGRIGYKHPNDENYVYIIGADRLSTDLHKINEQMNATYTKMDLDYTYNEEDDPNRFYFRSDHYNFAKNGIPIIFYFNGVHTDYHKPTDTPDKINLELLVKRSKLVFYTAWEIANRDERLVVDVK